MKLQPMTLIDWQEAHIRYLEVMRANTARWQQQGIIKTPEEVRIRAGRAMSINAGARKKAHAG